MSHRISRSRILASLDDAAALGSVGAAQNVECVALRHAKERGFLSRQWRRVASAARHRANAIDARMQGRIRCAFEHEATSEHMIALVANETAFLSALDLKRGTIVEGGA